MNLSICLRINGHIEARNYPLFKTRPVYTMTTPPKEVPRRLTFRSGKRNQRLAQRPVTENPLYRSWPTGGSRRREPCDIAPSALPARLQPDPGIFERQIVNSRRTLRQAKREGWSFACRSPGAEGPKRSKRRRDAGIVSDHICAVGRIRLNGRAGAKARVVDYAVAGHDRLRGINLDHLVVESVADQGVAVGQPHRARRQRRWIAARTRVREVLPEHFVVGINFDDATVVRVGKSVSRVWPLGRRLAKATPLTLPRAVKVATILLGVVCVTSMARLLFSSEMRMLPLASNSAALGLLSWLGPMPTTPFSPYCQTMALSVRRTSMMRSFP